MKKKAVGALNLAAFSLFPFLPLVFGPAKNDHAAKLHDEIKRFSRQVHEIICHDDRNVGIRMRACV